LKSGVKSSQKVKVMLKNKDITTESVPSRYLLEVYQVQILEGRILTIIDAALSSEVQSKAIKDLIKKEIRQIYNCPAWLPNEIMEKVEKERVNHPGPAF
jgi:hypothetical protein